MLWSVMRSVNPLFFFFYKRNSHILLHKILRDIVRNKERHTMQICILPGKYGFIDYQFSSNIGSFAIRLFPFIE